MNTTAFYKYWAEWFAQPESEKLKHLRSPGRGGYYPMNSEQPGYTGTADPKEYFHYRHTIHSLTEFGRATRELFWECFYKADDWCVERGLMDIACIVRPSDCVLRILHYPATPDGNVGQAHCDFDLLTVSVPGTVPGLEVWRPCEDTTCLSPGRGHWEKRESFEVHVGEMLSEYTSFRGNGAGKTWHKATPHRVRTPPNTERFKAVFFYLPPNDFELKPGFTAGQYLKDVLTRAGTAGIGAK